MQLTSPAFQNGEMIPNHFGLDFENINPPLEISNIPEQTVSMVLFMDDPDVPPATGVPVWDHWILFNIPASTTIIPENWRPTGIRGKGTRGELNYCGPRPPDRIHRYFFKIFALDSILDLPEGTTKSQIIETMSEHILDSAELIGRFTP